MDVAIRFFLQFLSLFIYLILLQFPRGDLEAHYQSKIHQEAIILCIEQILGKFKEHCQNMVNTDTNVEIKRPDPSNTITTTEIATDMTEGSSDNSKVLHSVIDTLADGTHNVAEELISLNSESIPLSQTVDKTEDLLSSVKTSIEESNNLLDAMHSSISMLHQDLSLLKQMYEDQQVASYDGTLYWKITEVRDKMSKNILEVTDYRLY